MPSDRITYSGTLVFSQIKADTGRTMRRGFCGACGSPVSIKRPETPLVEFVQAASFDDPGMFSPTVEVWTSSAAPWHPMHPTTEKCAEGPGSLVLEPVQSYFANRKA